jgi:hypothetical protein
MLDESIWQNGRAALILSTINFSVKDYQWLLGQISLRFLCVLCVSAVLEYRLFAPQRRRERRGGAKRRIEGNPRWQPN